MALVEKGEDVPERTDEGALVAHFLTGYVEKLGGLLDRLRLARDLARKLDRDRAHTADLSYDQWAQVDAGVGEASGMIRGLIYGDG